MALDGISKPPILLIHGGAASVDIEPEIKEGMSEGMRATATTVWENLQQGNDAVSVVSLAVEHLEKNVYFNAGLGSVIQADGVARLSASLMDGEKGLFSAVAQATHMLHPSKLAKTLQNRRNRVLSDIGAQLLARELGLAPENPITSYRLSRYIASHEKNSKTDGYGTVGAIAMDKKGRLAAATSTGGCGTDYPGRMSDVPTVAANFASQYAAISCTGIGEHIVDDAIAARLETRVRDGQSMVEASKKTMTEAESRKHRYGWIGIDSKGNWVIRYTTPRMNAAQISADQELLVL